MSDADTITFIVYLILVVGLIAAYVNQGGLPPRT